MRRYPKYKDSGIEWLGEIPEHWKIKSFKYLLLDGKEGIKIGPFGSSLKLDIMKPDGIKVYGQENIINDDFSLGHRFIDEDKFNELSTYKIQPGDIVISMMGTAGKSKVVPLNIPTGIIDSHLVRIRSNGGANPFFIALLINDSHYISIQIKQDSKGSIMDGLNSTIIKSLQIASPPIEEQKLIIGYIQGKIDQIDKLIKKKQIQIDLLKEYRAAIINEVVTKGLNPNVKMKDSGIEWLGEIPEHWKVKKVKHLLRKGKYAIKTGPFGSQLKSSDMVSNGVKVYNQRNVLDNNFKQGENYISIKKFEDLREFEVFPNDVLLTTRGTIGKCAIVPNACEKGVLHPCLIRIQIDGNLLLSNYLLWFIQDTALFKENIFYNSNATTIDVIYSDTLKQVYIPFPPILEQQAITSYLIQKTNHIDNLSKNIERQITLLQQYRTSLISEVVTGKIDVRDEVQ